MGEEKVTLKVVYLAVEKLYGDTKFFKLIFQLYGVLPVCGQFCIEMIHERQKRNWESPWLFVRFTSVVISF